MDNWPKKLRLHAVLSSTSTLLAHSSEDGFTLESVKEAKSCVDTIIEIIYYNSDRQLPENWSLLYAPTGPIQEVSLANGWGEAFLLLSEEYDALEHLIKKHMIGRKR